jgi:hypothetical protein
MIFGQDRHELRKMYADAWQKHVAGQPMSPLEIQISTVIAEHPEYQQAIAGDDLDRDYAPEGGQANPFLHMGLHLGIREQVATDRPAGIKEIHRQLVTRRGDAHRAEHEMIECLAETLWDAQRASRPPDEAQYLERLRRL